jgi:hypothetical protein
VFAFGLAVAGLLAMVVLFPLAGELYWRAVAFWWLLVAIGLRFGLLTAVVATRVSGSRLTWRRYAVIESLVALLVMGPTCGTCRARR